MHRINQEADTDPGTVRLSIDTKTTVPIGNLSRGGKSRGGKSRRPQAALDHDLEPEAKLTPFGIHRPDSAETWLFFTTGSTTADFMADRLHEIWGSRSKKTGILHIPSSVGKKVSRHTLLNLGTNFDLHQALCPELCSRVEQILSSPPLVCPRCLD